MACGSCGESGEEETPEGGLPANVVNMVLRAQMRSGDHWRRSKGEEEGRVVE